jgi:hypothetical protein
MIKWYLGKICRYLGLGCFRSIRKQEDKHIEIYGSIPPLIGGFVPVVFFVIFTRR